MKNKKQYIFFSILLILSGMFVNAQLETAHWYFGSYAGLDFTNGTPVPDMNGQVRTYEGSSSISDECGNLLFYTDGITVYDKNHNIMPNGTGLYGHFSSTQSAIIIPNPENTDIYYIFTVDGEESGVENKGLHYSKVDMSLNGGNGDLVNTEKNIPLPLGGVQKGSEKIAATPNADYTGYWVITHYLDTYYAFSVTSDGVNINPVASTDGILTNQIQGQLKISPDGARIAAAHYSSMFGQGGTLVLHDFDNATGIVSNPVIPHVPVYGRAYYGVEFSPNSKVLYATYQIYMSTFYLVQYDLTAASIINSQYVIDTSGPYDYLGALQLGLDDKIYLTEVNSDYLSVIHNPDVVYNSETGAEVDYEKEGVYLGGRKALLGLPSFILFRPQILVNGMINQGEYCEEEELTFSFTTSMLNVTETLWNFGDGTSSNEVNPTHTYTEPGEYIVTLTQMMLCGEPRVLTAEVEILPIPVVEEEIFLQKCFLQDEDVIFDLTEIYSQIDPDNESFITFHATQEEAEIPENPLPADYPVTTETTLFVRVENEYGCYIVVELDLLFYPLPGLTIENPDPEVCYGTSAELSIITDAEIVYWYDNYTAETPVGTGNSYNTPNLTAATTYWVEAISEEGCSSVKQEIIVMVNPLPVLIVETEDLEICEGHTTELSVSTDIGTINWYFTEEDTEPFHNGTMYETGELYGNISYWVEAVSEESCNSERLEITVGVVPIPSIDVTQPEAICEGNAVILEAVHDGEIVYWYAEEEDTEPIETGDVFETPVLYGTITYWVEAVSIIDDETRCVSERIPVEAEVIPLPELSLEPYEDEICEGETTAITVTTNGETVYWYYEEYDEIPFHNEFSFTTPPLSQSVVYWVETAGTGQIACTSGRIPVPVTVNLSPEIQETDTLYFCDSLNDGFEEEVDLTLNNINFTNNPNINLKYYASQQELEDDFPIDDPEHFPIYSSQGVVYVSAAAGEDGCPAYAELTVILTEAPAVSDTSLSICFPDGRGTYQLTEANENIIAGSINYTITYYLSYEEAKDGINPLPETYENVSANQTVFARVEEGENCFNIAEIALTYNNIFATIAPLEECDENNDGSAIFNLTDKHEEIEAEFGGSGYTIIYYRTLENAYDNVDEIPNPESYTNESNPQTVYAKVYDGDICLGIAAFDLIAIQLPEIAIETEITLCPGANYTIEAPLGYETYMWINPHGIFISTINSAILDTEGTYILEITFADNICVFREEIEVEFDDSPVVTNIEVNGSTVIITATGTVPLEYSMDGGTTWQSSNVFYDVAYGDYGVMVRSANSCESGAYPVVVFEITNIITPNGDGYNDTWVIPALVNYPGAALKIVDRYGKTLVDTNLENGFTWDGKHGGNPLPSTSYWYVLDLNNGQKNVGQITIKNY